ncbi:hypothetical protein [Wenzhouxiangella sp. XN24]|uniref:hypothetical protein n=1 Tax=Wenzhouxiangella sp. XN24 TaxID=2713569 RepID=UPI0013ECA32B|nr:hypothetical protein [Wenzhouxiangella sp. XN24]NGX16369.1 hypothetical protein [Wenzhouxiangella sp. XN24]
MRVAIPAVFATLLLALPAATQAETREAVVDFSNRQGQPERWVLMETVSGDAADRSVRREYRRDGELFYVEMSRVVDGTLTELLVTDRREGGEPVRVTRLGDRLTFTPLYEGAAPRSETVTGEVLAVGQVAPRLAELLRNEPGIREHRFRVPITKALKSAPMRARLTAVTADTFDVELRSSDFLVQTFFMRDSFRMSVERESGRLIRFEGQPEPYDLSSGRARSIWTAHDFAAVEPDPSAVAGEN